MEVDDDLLRYFDVDSDKLIDEKIKVLTDLKSGKQIIDIPNYYDVFELFQKKGLGNLLGAFL